MATNKDDQDWRERLKKAHPDWREKLLNTNPEPIDYAASRERVWEKLQQFTAAQAIEKARGDGEAPAAAEYLVDAEDDEISIAADKAFDEMYPELAGATVSTVEKKDKKKIPYLAIAALLVCVITCTCFLLTRMHTNDQPVTKATVVQPAKKKVVPIIQSTNAIVLQSDTVGITSRHNAVVKPLPNTWIATRTDIPGKQKKPNIIPQPPVIQYTAQTGTDKNTDNNTGKKTTVKPTKAIAPTADDLLNGMPQFAASRERKNNAAMAGGLVKRGMGAAAIDSITNKSFN